MAGTLTSEQIEKLSVEERLKLLQLICESLAEQSDELPAPEWHRAIIEQRLNRMEEDPHPGIPADEALASLGKRKA
ncbi:MAG: addiction module protein [Planctomycetes bacterium]|nr:addiction module protein [Planctomycetota bacterium]